MNFRSTNGSAGVLLLSLCALLTAGAARRSPVRSPHPKQPAAKASATPKKPAVANAAPPLPMVALGPPPKTLRADPATKDADLVIDYSSDWQGYLEPCG